MRHLRGPAASAPLRATLALLLGVTLVQPSLAQPAPAAPPPVYYKDEIYPFDPNSEVRGRWGSPPPTQRASWTP
jgi:hypothetical protein